ncbi:MAG: hypothetical protein K9G41_11625 [Flavobacteriales bacterium]|nr:hypothetical protein [Flavobacteriales bacterium]
MNLLKRIFLILASLFMVKLVLDQMKFALNYPPENLGLIWALFLGFFLSLTLTGIFAFVGFEFPVSRLLPNHFYRVKNPSKIRNLAAAMQIEWFRKFLLIFFWGGKNRKRFFDGTRSGLQAMMFETKQAEFGHLGGLILTIPISAFLIFRGFYFWVLFLQFFNLLGNFYPIMLQRIHRIQLQRIIDIQENRTKKPLQS